MNKAVRYMGIIILIVGMVVAFFPVKTGHYETYPIISYIKDLETGKPVPGSEKITGYDQRWVEETIFPYLTLGGIICLIGFVTTVIGGYMKAEAKETEQREDYVKLDLS